MVRTVVVWCPDWPVVAGAAAAGLAVRAPVAVLAAGRVLACSATARARRVRRGQRRREAQGRCPDLAVLPADPDRDARAFEPVVAAVEALAPGVDVVRPGLVALPARGPARYHGGEAALAERIVNAVTAHTGVTQSGTAQSGTAQPGVTQCGAECQVSVPECQIGIDVCQIGITACQVGIADGLFAATLAAHRGLLVPPGESAAFLAPLSIRELDQPGIARGDRRADRAGLTALLDLLGRLGLRTLGAFAALPVSDVAARFGIAGVRAHRLARGLDERPLARREPPPDLTVTRRFDPPLDRVDAAAFAARELAQQLHAVLAARGLAGVRLGVGARTEAGEELHRVWRCAEPLTAAGIADRVRWQLDGWLRTSNKDRGARPSAGIVELRLVPEEVVGGQALQRGLWGEPGEDDERAGRALLRVQGMLGPDAVLVGVPDGGRGPADQVRLVAWGEQPVPARDPDAPWPGRLPPPSPSRVPDPPLPAEVLDDTGRVVGVSGRGELTAAPHRVSVDRRPPRRVLSWAGPWLVEERWWEPGAGRRCARLQAVLDPEPRCAGTGAPGRRDDTGSADSADLGDSDQPLAVLLTCEKGLWYVEGLYE